MALIRLTEKAKAWTVTATLASVQTDNLGDFVASVEVTGMSGTSLVVDIQESPDPEDVTDANAVWYSLTAFAGITSNTTEKIVVTTRHFSRLRVKLTVVAASGNVSVIIEGEQVNLGEGNL